MIAHKPRFNPAEIDVAAHVDESDYFIVKDGVTYDLRIQADCDRLMTLINAQLIAMRAKWELIKAEADNLLNSVEHGIF